MTPLVEKLALPFTSSVTFENLLNLSEPQFHIILCKAGMKLVPNCRVVQTIN